MGLFKQLLVAAADANRPVPSVASPANFSQTLPPFVKCENDGSPEATAYGPSAYYAFNGVPVEQFGICRSCFETSIEPTTYANQFTRHSWNPSVPSMCDFSKRWVRDAWIYIFKSQNMNARVLVDVSLVQVPEGPCQNRTKTLVTQNRTFYVVRDPATRSLLTDFTICSHCKTSIETFLPRLKGLFVLASPVACQGTCDLPPYTTRTTDITQPILMGMSIQAQISNSAIDPTRLITFIKEFANVPECHEKEYVRGQHWYLPSIPALTVCGTCHQKYILPQSNAGKAIAKQFQVRQTAIDYACQLYSPRMQQMWADAARSSDLSHLTTFATARAQKNREFAVSMEQLRAHRKERHATALALGELALSHQSSELQYQTNALYTGWHVSINHANSASTQTRQQGNAVSREAFAATAQMERLENEWETHWE